MFLLYFINFLLIVFEKAVLSSIIPLGFIPQIELIFCTILSFWWFTNKSDDWFFLFLFIFLSGILFDFFSLNYIGLSSIILLLISSVTILINRIIPSEIKLINFPSVIILNTIIYNGLVYLFSLLVGKAINYSIVAVMIKMILINLLTGLVLFLFLTKVFSKIYHKKELEVN